MTTKVATQRHQIVNWALLIPAGTARRHDRTNHPDELGELSVRDGNVSKQFLEWVAKQKVQAKEVVSCYEPMRRVSKGQAS